MASTISAGTTTTTSLVYTADTSGVLQLQTNGTTTAVTIDTAQNLLVGGTSALNSSSGRGDVEIFGSSSAITSYNIGGSIAGYLFHDGTNFQLNNNINNSGTIQFYTRTSGSGTEKVRIDNSGNLLVGITSGSGGRVVSVPQSGFNTSGANNWKAGAFQGQGSFGGPLSFVNTAGGNDGFCFYLQNNPSTLYIQFGANGGSLSNGVQLASTATSWSSASDERLKTTITPFPNALEKVCTLRAGTGRFLTDAENLSRSFLIAQDVQKVLPEAVDVGQDELQTLSLRYQDLIPLLTASIQELSAKVTALEAKVG